MQIEYCPKCGAEVPGTVVDGDTQCSECDWYYGKKEYQRIGTHPSEFDRYCEECLTVYETADEAQMHLCTAVGLLDEYGTWPIDALLDELIEYHGESRACRKLRSAVEAGTVVYTDDFMKMELWPDEELPDLAERIYAEIESLEQSSGGGVGVPEVSKAVKAPDELANDCVAACVRELYQIGELQWGIDGVKTT